MQTASVAPVQPGDGLAVRTSPSASCAIATTRCGCATPRRRRALRRRAGTVVYNEDDGLPAAPIFHLEQMADGTLYAGTERGAYRRVGERFEPVSPRLPADGVPSLVRDAAGDLWVGTINHGLLRLGTDGLDSLSSQTRPAEQSRRRVVRRSRRQPVGRHQRRPAAPARCAVHHVQHRTRPERRLRARARAGPRRQHLDRHQPRSESLAGRQGRRRADRAPMACPAIRS